MSSVMVFVPAPMLTVTIEQQAESVELHVHPGGQGIWQARMIVSLGVEVTLCIALGGEVGAVLDALLPAEDVTVRAVTRGADTGWYVHDRRGGQRLEVAQHPGAPLVRHDLDELYNLALVEGLKADVSVLAGPVHPSVVAPDVYRRLAADLRANGGRVVADLSGEHLTAALAGGVEVVKVGYDELLANGRATSDSVGDLVAAGRQMREEGAGTVVISRAGEPALAILADRVLQVRTPHLEVADPIGAGDSMTAGIAAVLARGGDVEEAIRTGAAAGALNVTRHGLGTGRPDAIRELTNRVELATMPGRRHDDPSTDHQ